MGSDLGRNSGSLSDKSGAGSTTSAQVASANTYRKYFYFQNLDATIAQFINFGAAATAGSGSIKVAAGASVQFTIGEFCPTDAINVIAASGTPAYTAKEG